MTAVNTFERLYKAKTGTTKEMKKSVRKELALPSDPFQESVYNLIPEVVKAVPKEKRYKSNYSDQAREEFMKNARKAASMGPLKVPLPPTKAYLKKGAGVTRPVANVSPRSKSKVRNKGPVPDHDDRPTVPPSTKDFVKQNALDNINSLPKNVNLKDASPLDKKDFGKTPAYLQKRIVSLQEEQAAAEKAKQLFKEQAENIALQKQGLVVLPDEERARILSGLKANWDKHNYDYQRLSLTVDTVPKIARKVHLENQLKHYEELIRKFEKTKIHVSFD